MIQPTLNDVARRAGVSRGTVSRVLNGRADVKPETRERILRIMHELNYHPSGVARGLRLGNTRTIALLVSDISGNAHFSTIVHGVEDVAQEHGYTVLLGNTNEDDAKEQAYLKLFAERRVEGLILVSSSRIGVDNMPLIELQNSGVPCVVYNRVVDDECIGTIHLDNDGAAFLIIRHLIEHGRRRIAMIGGPADRRSFQQRMSGYCKALEQAGLPFEPQLVINCPITEDGGQAGMEWLLTYTPCVDAVFAASDRLAVGVMLALEAANLRVPQDVAVAGFDNIPIAPYLHPALTTVAPPYDLIGRRAAIMLFDQLVNNAVPRREILPCGLQIRASSI